jgi:hypothetical protein
MLTVRAEADGGAVVWERPNQQYGNLEQIRQNALKVLAKRPAI